MAAGGLGGKRLPLSLDETEWERRLGGPALAAYRRGIRFYAALVALAAAGVIATVALASVDPHATQSLGWLLLVVVSAFGSGLAAAWSMKTCVRLVLVRYSIPAVEAGSLKPRMLRDPALFDQWLTDQRVKHGQARGRT